jgi:hypothetical protein
MHTEWGVASRAGVDADRIEHQLVAGIADRRQVDAVGDLTGEGHVVAAVTKAVRVVPGDERTRFASSDHAVSGLSAPIVHRWAMHQEKQGTGLEREDFRQLMRQDDPRYHRLAQKRERHCGLMGSRDAAMDRIPEPAPTQRHTNRGYRTPTRKDADRCAMTR